MNYKTLFGLALIILFVKHGGSHCPTKQSSAAIFSMSVPMLKEIAPTTIPFGKDVRIENINNFNKYQFLIPITTTKKKTMAITTTTYRMTSTSDIKNINSLGNNSIITVSTLPTTSSSTTRITSTATATKNNTPTTTITTTTVTTNISTTTTITTTASTSTTTSITTTSTTSIKIKIVTTTAVISPYTCHFETGVRLNSTAVSLLVFLKSFNYTKISTNMDQCCFECNNYVSLSSNLLCDYFFESKNNGKYLCQMYHFTYRSQSFIYDLKQGYYYQPKVFSAATGTLGYSTNFFEIKTNLIINNFTY